MITILTPTYNRGYIIKKVYDSLIRQKNVEMEWLVIDDGSTDHTKEIIEAFQAEQKLHIRYFYKKNGGKHTALNLGIKKAHGEYLMILDSDDYLTDDALEKINKYWSKVENNPKVCSCTFLKQYPTGEIIGKRYQGTEILSDNIDFRYNQGNLGDMAEVYRTKILQKYTFPVFLEESFLSEAVVWNQMALDYQTFYINEPICICEYLEDGLSKSCLHARIRCPKGARENAKVFLHPRFKFAIRLKNSILYTGFSLLAKDSLRKIYHQTPYHGMALLGVPGGVIFYFYLRYLKKKGKKKREN